LDINGVVYQQMVNVLFCVLAHDMSPQVSLNQPSLSFQFVILKIELLKAHQAYRWFLPVCGITIEPEMGEVHCGACPHFDGRAVCVSSIGVAEKAK